MDCGDIFRTNMSFFCCCHFVFLSFCLFVILSFCHFVGPPSSNSSDGHTSKNLFGDRDSRQPSVQGRLASSRKGSYCNDFCFILYKIKDAHLLKSRPPPAALTTQEFRHFQKVHPQSAHAL